jgi:hypothetical protein
MKDQKQKMILAKTKIDGFSSADKTYVGNNQFKEIFSVK